MFIMIIITTIYIGNSGGISVATAEFSGRSACEEATQAVKSVRNNSTQVTQVICVPK